jgi:hypothetical protein
MVHDSVEEDADPGIVKRIYQNTKIVVAPETRIDVIRINDIVAVGFRNENRPEEDRRGTKIPKIRDPLGGIPERSAAFNGRRVTVAAHIGGSQRTEGKEVIDESAGYRGRCLVLHNRTPPVWSVFS